MYAVYLPLLLWAFALGLVVWGTFISLRAFNTSPPRLDMPFGLFPVSILKPLKGKDEGLRENLETFFNLDYPAYELLFSLADPQDPARPVVEKLMACYPGVRARLIIERHDVGPNPKVNNLIGSYAQAVHDWILISDSNVRVDRDYLKRQVAHLEPGVGMVTAIVAGRAPRGVGGLLESVYLNTFYARGMRLAERVGHPCVVGKSMLFQRSTANRFGGVAGLGCYLAEDYMAGKAIESLGLRVVVAMDPVNQHIGRYTLHAFWSRHVRWGRIRKAQAPLAFFLEPVIGPVVSGLLGGWALHSGFGLPLSTFLIVHLGMWSACDFLMSRRLEPGLTFSVALTWFVREFLAIPLWIHIALGNTVSWRGNRMSLLPGGMLSSRNDETTISLGSCHEQPSD